MDIDMQMNAYLLEDRLILQLTSSISLKHCLEFFFSSLKLEAVNLIEDRVPVKTSISLINVIVLT